MPLDQIVFTDKETKATYAEAAKMNKQSKKTSAATSSTRVTRSQVKPTYGAVRSYGNLEVGMRVIAFAENERAKEITVRGVIRYLGKLPEHKEYYAGLELVSNFSEILRFKKRKVIDLKFQ